MNKTIAYIRVSSEKQTEGNGLDQQRLTIMSWAVANQVQIDEWVSEAETGTTADREQVTELIAAAKAGQFSRLVVDRLDRFARKLVVSEQLYQEFTDAGVEVVSATIKLESSPTGNMIRQMLGAIAEYQRSEWLGRMKVCRAQSVRKKGGFKGGETPLGYVALGDGKLGACPRTAPAVRLCFLLRSQGLTYQSICLHLSEKGHNTSNGTKYSPAQVQRILKNKAVYQSRACFGSTQPDGVKPAHPPLIE